ncbi:MAG: hypothetical protein A2177_03495 [Spirochaetes bacterium RBG_13_68_11]|nr:MAG: hypothetical protein A2177_03495 [Spirochaetes bacterium RBG_13_68_11]
MQRVVDLALGAAAAALLVLLAVPWKAAPLPGATGNGPSPQPQPEAARHETRTTVPPDAILRLFTGGGPAAAARAAPSPDAKPVDASWLRYMGRSSAPDGTTSVYVKDTKSGKVIRATRGEALDGWILVSEDASGLTLQHGDDLYAVSKK